MKRQRIENPSHANTVNKTTMTLSKAEVREMVQNEVQNARKQSQAKMDALPNDAHYACALGKLEIQIEKLKRRADAAIDHIMKLGVNNSQDTPQLKISRSSVAGTAKSKISRSDLGDESTPTASHITMGSTAVKDNGKLLQAMEATNKTMRMMQANNEALKVAHDDLEKGTSNPLEDNLFNKLHAVPIKKECDRTEMSVDGHYGVNKEEPQEQPIATNIKVERLDEEESFPHNHLEQEASVYPPLPATPFPSVLNIEAASYSLPPRLSLQLALIRHPPGLSILWDVEEKDPSAPPMESYSVYMAMEKDKGSGVFPEWKTLGIVKAIPLPMCVMVSKFKPGFKACFAVVAKDMFGRYGPYSKIIPAVIPDQNTHLP